MATELMTMSLRFCRSMRRCAYHSDSNIQQDTEKNQVVNTHSKSVLYSSSHRTYFVGLSG